MRQIKFRAWDSLNKRIIYGYFFIDADGDVWYNQDPNAVDMSGTIKIKHTDKLTIMQFTGIKDRNGTEIYEGDIILDTLTKAVMKVMFGKNTNQGYCGWFGRYINIEVRDVAINGDYYTDINSQIEVIDDIYQTTKY